MAVDINSLAKQYQGRKFGELVLHHQKKQNQSEVANAMIGTAQSLRPNIASNMEKWIDFESSKGEESEYWSKDCGEALKSICKEAEIYFRLYYQIQLSVEERFSIFNITVLNYAFAAHGELSTKAFIQKSIGIGFMGRVFS